MPSVTTIIALGLGAPQSGPNPKSPFVFVSELMITPLPWRKVTPLHRSLGARSERFSYTSGQGLPSQATPQTINARYDASTALDRIIGFTLSIGAGDATPCEFVLQELNTGWFIDYSYPGTKGAYLSANIETLPDEVALQFYFTADLIAPVYLSFQNFEIVPHHITGAL